MAKDFDREGVIYLCCLIEYADRRSATDLVLFDTAMVLLECANSPFVVWLYAEFNAIQNGSVHYQYRLAFFLANRSARIFRYWSGSSRQAYGRKLYLEIKWPPFYPLFFRVAQEQSAQDRFENF